MDDCTYAELDYMLETEQLIKKKYPDTPIIKKHRSLSNDSSGYIDSADCDSCPEGSPISLTDSDFEDGSHRMLNKRIVNSVSDNVSEESYIDPDDALEKERLMKAKLEGVSELPDSPKIKPKLSTNILSKIRDSVPGLQEIVGKTGREQMNKALNEYLNQEPSDEFIMTHVDIEELSDIFSTLVCIKYMDVTGCKLKNLKHLPPNLERLNARDNELTEIFSSEIPINVSDLAVSRNKIVFVDLSLSHNIEKLNISSNPLTNLVLFPPNVIELNVASTNIDNIDHFERLKYLRNLKLNTTNIDTLDGLPNSIVELSATNILLGKNNGIIANLPNNLEKFVAINSGIRLLNFNKFPPFLKYLDLSNNEINSLPQLPDKMDFLDVSSNNLLCVENVPYDGGQGTFDYSYNPSLLFTPGQKEIIDALNRYSHTMIKIDNLDDNDHNKNFYSNQGRRFGSSSHTMDDDWEWINRHQGSNKNYNTCENRQSSIIKATYQEQKVLGQEVLEQEQDIVDQLLFSRPSNTNGANDVPIAPGGPPSLPQDTTVPPYTPPRQPLVPHRMSYGGRGGKGKRFGRRGHCGGMTYFGPQNQHRPDPIPQYVRNIMGSDTFCATKDPKMAIKHKHIYTV